ncbi:MAG: tetratricopeptide repeat protein [Rhodospirillales bacterium]
MKSNSPPAAPAADEAEIRQFLGEGLARHRIGDTDGAAAAYREVLRLDPHQADALNLLGVVMQQTGNLVMAETLTRAAAEAAPEFAPYHVNLGNALQAKGDAEGAAEAFRRALALQPDLAEAHANLGSALSELKTPRDAIPHLEQARAGGVTTPGLALKLALAYLDTGAPRPALDAFQEAVGRWPEDAQLRAGVGMALLALDRAEEAEAPLRAALAADPENEAAQGALSACMKTQAAKSDGGGSGAA